MTGAAIPWYRTPLDREALRALTRRSDLRGWLQAGSLLLALAATTAAAFLLFRLGTWPAAVAACYVHSMLLGFLSMAAAVHELSHGTVFRRRLPNEVFYRLFAFLTWNNPVHFRASHALHHQLTVFRGRDREVVQAPVAQKLNRVNFLGWLTFDIPYFLKYMRLNVLHALGRGDADYFSWDPLFPPEDPRRRAMCRWARFTLIGHLLLLALFIGLRLWPLVYLLVFAPFFATWPSRLCTALQHTGLDASRPDWRLVCHTVRFNPLLRYLYWNMNYHTEHHMYAAVPFYNLPKLHAALRHDLPVPPRSFLAGIALLLRIRRRQAVDPSYVHVPVFPETAAAPRFE